MTHLHQMSNNEIEHKLEKAHTTSKHPKENHRSPSPYNLKYIAHRRAAISKELSKTWNFYHMLQTFEILNFRYHSDEPELYQVYKGRVSRVMDTGCFVQLTDFRGKEGLVHVSQIANRRISNTKDFVKRDQEVYVKVISVSGQKLSLSMRDVDQNSGKDLLPLKKSSDDDAFRTNPSGVNNRDPTTRTGLSD
ncbi:putative pre-mRNA-splicing factor ATP-dependent RNA helicase DEAH5 [Camellia lanceoleosa]|uniref:Pre-mRNA-splicing factor ATP-dependent RNA helicase DEAH5 n=1 Tax=Camellia lanceoleosa TaxID=1840588 RepID=A0ACC0IS51_9ERIC|nr:putative pre-mRNA-splicing factor ATP-dependent RNA helicase DEAH5 [Camellia lanceoleosa]